MRAYESISHRNLYFLAVASFLDGKIGFHGLISRHIGPNESSPPLHHQAIYSTQCLNGHSFGLELFFRSCTPKTIFYDAMSDLSPIGDKDHIISQPTEQMKRNGPHCDPPINQEERSDCYNPGLDRSFGKIMPKVCNWRQNVEFWRNFEVEIRNLSTHLRNSV